MDPDVEDSRKLLALVMEEAKQAWDQEVASALMQAGPDADSVARMITGTPELLQCFQAGVAWGFQKGVAMSLLGWEE